VIEAPAQAVQPASPPVKSEPVLAQPTVKPIEQPIVQPIIQQAKQPLPEKLVEKLASDPQKLHIKINEKSKTAAEEKKPLPNREPTTDTASAGSVPGWNCKSGDSKSWNCNLVGPDPQGEAKQVSTVATAQNAYFLTPTFNQAQERTFQTLRAEFDSDPWQNCQTWGAKKRKVKPISQDAREKAETVINADSSEIFDGDVMSFAGNVDLTRADQHMLADQASYDNSADTMDAQGNVIYSEQQLAFASDTASLSLNKDEARLRKAQFIAAEAPLRGSADVVYRDSKDLTRYHQAAFTSCAPGNQDWMAHAERLKINRETGQGSAKNAWLEFKGVPILYTPYISFPTDNRRLSGLLAPNFSASQRNGFDTTVPFYWNIAPNYDMIVTPRYLAKRGGMLREKFRYMTDSSKGTFGAEYMPNDEILNKARYSASLKEQRTLTSHLSSMMDLNYVSDNRYFNDLNNALGFQTSSYLPSIASLNYARPNVAFSTGIQHYQSVDKYYSENKALMPYDVLPRVNLNLNHDFANLPITVAMDNQFSYFYHQYSALALEHYDPEDPLKPARPNAQRFNIAPSLSMPLESTAGFFNPKITAQYTQYQLTNQVQGTPSSIGRMLPIFSVDTGTAFEKQINFGDSPYTHAIEPRMYYLYIPRKDQNNIPLFDSSILDTNFYSLFRENRFSGIDRIQDANQLTLAGTSRFIDSKTGLEPLKVSLGQILYFQDRDVNLPGIVNQKSSTSNFIGEVGGQVTKNLSYMTGAQWDPEANSFARGQAVLKFRNQSSELFDIGYRFRRKDNLIVNGISQTDVSFRWPLFNEWYGLGRWQYSLNFDRTTESFIGLEKENCCWRFRVIARRYINGYQSQSLTGVNLADASLKPETAFFFQLELKGLTSFGDSVDTFLQTNLNGYRKASYYE
jgi:LPS-assembly protein